MYGLCSGAHATVSGLGSAIERSVNPAQATVALQMCRLVLNVPEIYSLAKPWDFQRDCTNGGAGAHHGIVVSSLDLSRLLGCLVQHQANVVVRRMFVLLQNDHWMPPR